MLRQAMIETEPNPVVQISGTVPVSGSVTTSGTTTNTPVSGSSHNLVTAATTNIAVIKATAGNLAFPYSPSDFHGGEVYNFSVYHLMEINDNDMDEIFKIDYEIIKGVYKDEQIS